MQKTIVLKVKIFEEKNEYGSYNDLVQSKFHISFKLKNTILLIPHEIIYKNKSISMLWRVT